MVDIIVDLDALSKSKVHPIDIERARKKMMENPNFKPPRAKKKWQEIVYLEQSGLRLAINCHKEQDKIVITGIRKMRKEKPIGPPHRRV